MPERILITGAAGGIGTLMRPRLARPDRVLRLMDICSLPPAEPDEAVEFASGSVTDPEAMRAACADVDAVIHLGGLSTEASWERMLETNIHGTYVMFEAARQAGVPRVIFASSNHAVGFHPLDAGEAPDYLFPRPDTFYGVSKVTGEALGSLYHDRHGLDVVCLRIGTCFERPHNARALATWLSPDDCARLIEASLAAPSPGFRVVWGISANSRSWFGQEEARSLGFESQDDAERFATPELLALTGKYEETYLGGAFCAPTDDEEEEDLT